MPDHSRYDLDYRPPSYWVFENEDQRIGATVKGTFRRYMARLSLRGDVLGDMEPFRFESALPEEIREMRMTIDPVFGSGEYLEDLKEGVVEIARVTYRSTFTDVVSVRAWRAANRIWYGVVDDFMGGDGRSYQVWTPQTSVEPLTMRELIQLMNTASEQPDDDPDGWFTGLVQGPCKPNYESVVGHSNPMFTLEGQKRFAVASSDFYPELSSWYEDVDEEMYEEYRKKDLAIREKKDRQDEDAGL